MRLSASVKRSTVPAHNGRWVQSNGGIITGRVKPKFCEKQPVPVPLCRKSHISHPWGWTRASAIQNRWVTNHQSWRTVIDRPVYLNIFGRRKCFGYSHLEIDIRPSCKYNCAHLSCSLAWDKKKSWAIRVVGGTSENGKGYDGCVGSASRYCTLDLMFSRRWLSKVRPPGL
jgi:hypothetical protein